MVQPRYLAGLPSPDAPDPDVIEAEYSEEENLHTAKASDILPRMLKDPVKLKEFEATLDMMCQASAEQLEAMQPIWKQLDDGQKNKSPMGLKPPYKGAPEYHFPVLEPNLDRGRAFIAQPLSKANPHFLVHAGGASGERTGRVETALHLILSRAKYPRWLRMAIDVAQRRGKAVLRPLFEAAERHPNGRETPPGVRLDVFSPEHVDRYPNWAIHWQDVLMVGTRWECSLQEVRYHQEQGYFLTSDTEIVGGKEADVLGENFEQNREDNSVDESHEPVTMRDLFVPGWMLGEHRKCWFRVWFWKNGTAVLRVEKWGQRRYPLFDFFLHEEYNRWLNERSRARSINGPQMFANDIRRLFVWATLYQVTPPVFGMGVGLPRMSQQPAPGTVTPLQGSGTLTAFNPQLNLSPFAHMIQLAKEDAELAAHLSLSSHGITTPGVTATAVNKAGLGQDVGNDEDVAYAGFGLCEMAEYIALELLYDHFLDWYPWFADSLPRNIERKDFDRPYHFAVNGEVATDTPEAVLANITQLTQAIAQIVQLNPQIAANYPDLFPGLVRAAVDAANRGNMDSLLPTPEEEETLRAQREALGSINGLEFGIPGGLGASLPIQGMGLSPGMLG